MTTEKLTKSALSQFTGSDIWYRFPFVPDFHYTQGVRFVANTGGAHWLIDEIAFAQHNAAVKAEEFQHWMLTVNADQTAKLHCTDGNDKTVFEKAIEFTDFPLDKISFYFANTVLLLPSEN